MITRVMTWTAQPGRGLELVAVLKEVAALSAKINGVSPPVVATTVGGAIGEVSLIAQAIPMVSPGSGRSSVIVNLSCFGSQMTASKSSTWGGRQVGS